MLGLFIILLTAIMIVDCIVLVLLVLMQLPKKEAGAGLAFGGAATDALFGAGSGNLLTKATKYAAGIFFALAVALSLLQNHYYRSSGSTFRREVEQQSKQPMAAPAPVTPAPVAPTVPGTNQAIPVLRSLGTNSP